MALLLKTAIVTLIFLIHTLIVSVSPFQLGTCEGRCGEEDINDCDCTAVCSVYRTCCRDVESVCPGVIRLGMDKLDPLLLDADIQCGARTGRYEIASCPILDPRKQSDFASQDYEIGSKDFQPSSHNPFDDVKPPYDQIPIYDTQYDLLFKNFSIYRCYRRDFSYARFWQFVFKFDVGENIKSTEDMLSRLADPNASHFFQPTNSSQETGEEGKEEGRRCDEHSGLRDFMFFITIDLRDDHMEINSYPRHSGFNFETMVCDREGVGRCLHTVCEPSGSIVGGKCIQRVDYIVRALHPPRRFTHTELDTISRYLTCAATKQDPVISMTTSMVKPIADFPFKMYSLVPMELQGNLTFFEIIFHSLQDGVLWDLKVHLMRALAVMYEHLDLAHGYPFLEFLGEKETEGLKTSNKSDTISTPRTTLSPSPCTGHLHTDSWSTREERAMRSSRNFLDQQAEQISNPEMLETRLSDGSMLGSRLSEAGMLDEEVSDHDEANGEFLHPQVPGTMTPRREIPLPEAQIHRKLNAGTKNPPMTIRDREPQINGPPSAIDDEDNDCDNDSDKDDDDNDGDNDDKAHDDDDDHQDNDNSDDDHFNLVLGCVNQYITKPIPKESEFCDTGLDNLKRTDVDFGECVLILNDIPVKSEGESVSVASTLLPLWAICYLVIII